MNIVLISQCSKQALPATRRILDQFAERKGSRTWLTPITEAGLDTLHELLRHGARRNTAVSCHRVRGGEIDLLWIVGNRSKFDRRGNVPTDTTGNRLLQRHREDTWRHTEAVALLALIAGLFHDFGKANGLFQAKLAGTRDIPSEPLRHEWVSLRLFEAFVGDDTDEQWLTRLGVAGVAEEKALLQRLTPDAGDGNRGNPLTALEGKPVAWTVGWLICTHHRLPVPVRGNRTLKGARAARWREKLQPSWISPQFVLDENDPKAMKRRTAEEKKLWRFPAGLPFSSKTWRQRAASASRRALRHPGFVSTDWTAMPFVLHVARCSLMLADHQYSAAAATPKWQDSSYKALANTEFVPDAGSEGARRPKQHLDEHCIGVSSQAYLVARSLPMLRPVLPAIGNVRKLRARSKGRFSWQNKAFALAEQSAVDSRRQGGFFVNMASTGTGKTLGNARVAFGLSKGGDGTRFTVLLGLRTLTLQTASALRERLGLREADLATLVGSAAVRELHERKTGRQDVAARAGPKALGSESASSLFAEHEYVRYDGALDESRVGRWLKGDRDGARLHRLVSAPVVVGTIDHVMPATESGRGGHQIAPMLRLLTSDLVLDEPDDFDLADQPALCRLVHWAGLLGSRVVLSSATLPPALVENLFDAYRAGRQEFNRMTQAVELPIVCGWMDEFSAERRDLSDIEAFVRAHAAFVDKRLERTAAVPSRRLVRLAQMSCGTGTVHDALASVLREQIPILHEAHAQIGTDGHRVSIGVVRMANINPLVGTVTALAREGGFGTADVHVCVYHARHPLRRRAQIELELDSLLDRTVPESLWRHPSIVAACKRPAKDQIFMVMATSVAEVGRDHDYDWAVIEPSSMRSILQLCGRVLRHRVDQVPEQPNVVLLGRNLRGLADRTPSFTRPGYETRELALVSRDIVDVLPVEHRERPSLASRIAEGSRLMPHESLVDLEHVATRRALDGDPASFPASLWWKEAVHWCFALQRETPFRAGAPTDTYALVTDDRAITPTFERWGDDGWKPRQGDFQAVEPDIGQGMIPWPATPDLELVSVLAEEEGEEEDGPGLERACRRFLTVSLDRREADDLEPWCYHWWLGVHRRT